MNAPMRVDDLVIFWDGTSRKLTKDEIRRLDAGEIVFADPRSGLFTPSIGDVLYEKE